jgi:hypothetical protein
MRLHSHATHSDHLLSLHSHATHSDHLLSLSRRLMRPDIFKHVIWSSAYEDEGIPNWVPVRTMPLP